jgi:hypothetical protein
LRITCAHPRAIQTPLAPTGFGVLQELAGFERPFLLERDQGAVTVPTGQRIAHHTLEIATLLAAGQVGCPGDDQRGGQGCVVMLPVRLATQMLHRRLGVKQARAVTLLQGLHGLPDVGRQMQAQMMALRQPGVERSTLHGAQHTAPKRGPIGLAPLGPQQHIDPRAVVMRLDRRRLRTALRGIRGRGDDQIHRAFAQSHEAILRGHGHQSQPHAQMVGQFLGQIDLQSPVAAFRIKHPEGREIGPHAHRHLAPLADSFQRGAVRGERRRGRLTPQHQQADAHSKPPPPADPQLLPIHATPRIRSF